MKSNIGNDHNSANQTNALITIAKQLPSQPEKPQIENGTITWGGKTYAIMYGDEHIATHGQQENIEKIVLATFNFLGDKIDPRSLAKMRIDPSQVEYHHTHQKEVVSEKFTGATAQNLHTLFKKITEKPLDQELKNDDMPVIKENKLEEREIDKSIPIKKEQSNDDMPVIKENKLEEREIDESIPIKKEQSHDDIPVIKENKLEEDHSPYDFPESVAQLLREIDNPRAQPENPTLKSNENFEGIKNFIDQVGTNKITYNKKTGEFNVIDRKNEPLHDKVGNSKESRKSVEKLLAMIDDHIDGLNNGLKDGIIDLKAAQEKIGSIKDLLKGLTQDTGNSWVKKVIENQKSVKGNLARVDDKAQNLVKSLDFAITKGLHLITTAVALPKDNSGLEELGRWLENCPGEFDLAKGKLKSPDSEQKEHQYNNEKKFAAALREVVRYINAVKKDNPSEGIQENLNKISKSLSENPKIYLLLKNPEHKNLKEILHKILPQEKFFKKIKTGGVDLKQIQRDLRKIKKNVVNFSSQESIGDVPIKKLLTINDIELHKKDINELSDPIRPIKLAIDKLKSENDFIDSKVSTKETKNIIAINKLKIQLLQEEQLTPLMEKRRKVAEEINNQQLPNITIKSDLSLSDLAIMGEVTDYIGGEPVVNVKDTTGISSSFDDVMKSEKLFQKQMIVFRQMISEIGPKEGKQQALQLLDNIINSSIRLLSNIGDPPSLGGMLNAFNPANMQRVIKNFIEASNSEYLNQEFDKKTTKKFIKNNAKDYPDVNIDLNSLQMAAVQRGLRYPMMFKDGVKAQLDRYEIKQREEVEGYEKDLTPFHEPINQIERSLGLLGVLFDSLKR